MGWQCVQVWIGWLHLCSSTQRHKGSHLCGFPLPEQSSLQVKTPDPYQIFHSSSSSSSSSSLSTATATGTGTCRKMPWRRLWSWRLRLMPWLTHKIIDPLHQLLRKGAEPRQLAFSSALGATLGVFPICGVTMILCGVATALLRHRCHAPTIMLVNLLVTPIEISLVIPLLRLGEAICGDAHFPLTTNALTKVVTGQASKEIFVAVSHALLGWAILTPFIFGALYLLLLPCFKLLVHKFRSPIAPKQVAAAVSETKIKVRDL